MSKKVKALIQKELKSRFADVDECLVVSVRGLKGEENNQMRGELLDKQIRLTVVKNSLARRAFCELGAAPMAELLTGPCAVAYGGDSIVDVAKIFRAWGKKFEQIEIKGGLLAGEILGAAQARGLAEMPSRAELQARVSGQAQGPGAGIAGAIGGPAGYLAGCIAAVVEKLENNQPAEAA